MKPEDIPLGWYTHINFAFALINPKTFHIDPMDADTATLYDAVTGLKRRQTGLEVWIGKSLLLKPYFTRFLLRLTFCDSRWWLGHE